jgi:hypothetical protein
MNNNNASSTSPAGLLPTTIAGVVDTKNDNTIYSSQVDGSFNPSFLTVSSGTVSISASASVPLVVFIAGRKEVLIATLGPTSSILTASSANYIYLTYSTSPGSTNIGSTTLAPVYSRTAPTCTTNQFWFDLSTRLMKSCSGGVYSANTVIFLAVIVTTSGNAAAAIAYEPWGLDPYTRSREFGNGSAGATNTTSSNTCDGWVQYSAVELTTSGSLTHSQISPTNSKVGCYAYSQNPVVITGTSTVDLKGLGRAGGGAVSSASDGNTGNNGGFGGAAGGGGGSNANKGGAGGGHSIPQAYTTSGGGSGGNSPNGAAGSSSAQNTSNFVRFNCDQFPPLGGAGGGSGGGMAAGSGGKGGDAGGGLCLKAPAIVINTTGVFDADGAGTSGTGACTSPAGNNGQGGGPGGGTIFFDAYYAEITSTITVAAGTRCTNSGSGGAGTDGQAGIQVTLQRQ